MSEPVIQIKNLFKSFITGTGEISVLKDVSLDIDEGDFLIIFGPSGCGKSTLLHVMLGLEEPSKGEVFFLGKNLYNKTSEDDRSSLRKNHIGMVYQQPYWVKALSVLENVAFPLLLLGQDEKQSLARAERILEVVEMNNWANFVPTELSSGQQQKISLARALITDPEIIVADEPTGNLDSESSQELMQLLADLNKSRNKTIIMVTHDMEYLKFAKRSVRIFDGKIAGIYDGEKDREKIMASVKIKKGLKIDERYTS